MSRRRQNADRSVNVDPTKDRDWRFCNAPNCQLSSPQWTTYARCDCVLCPHCARRHSEPCVWWRHQEQGMEVEER